MAKINKSLAILSLFVISLLYVSTMALADTGSGYVLIGRDEEGDLMSYTDDYMDDEVDYPTSTDPDELYDEMDTLIDQLEAEWGSDDEDIGEAVDSPNEIDIEKMWLNHLDKNIASLYVTFYGTPQESQYGFLFSIWTDCSDVEPGIIIDGIFSPPLAFNMELVYIMYGDESEGYGSIEFHDNIMRISLDSEHLKQNQNGDWKMAIWTFDYDLEYYTWDIFSNKEQKQDTDTWMWIIILAIIAGCVAVVGGYAILRIRKNKNKTGKAKLKR